MARGMLALILAIARLLPKAVIQAVQLQVWTPNVRDQSLQAVGINLEHSRQSRR